jgi:predicted nucleotidyltransferase
MEHEGSDEDVFECYQAPTLDILRGNAFMKSTFDAKVANQDIARHELGTVIEQLLKGNLNFVVGVMSPIVEETSETHKDLIALFRAMPPKNLYHSVRGMAVHNVKLYQDELDFKPKKVNAILRLLFMGEAYLRSGVLLFEPYYGTRSEIDPMLERLDKAYQDSPLIDQIPELLLRDILLKARLVNLGEPIS